MRHQARQNTSRRAEAARHRNRGKATTIDGKAPLHASHTYVARLTFPEFSPSIISAVSADFSTRVPI